MQRGLRGGLRQYFDDCDPDFHVLARIDNRLVGHAMAVTRWLRAGDGPLLRTAYVELVATAQGFRNRGIGARVMRKVAEVAVNESYELAALCPADTDLYLYLGWERWQGQLYIRVSQERSKEDRTLIATPEERIMILKLPRTPFLDLTLPLSAEWRHVGELW